jgi:hypothetical protein
MRVIVSEVEPSSHDLAGHPLLAQRCDPIRRVDAEQ